jgi:single-strand DNA-binding protein
MANLNLNKVILGGRLTADIELKQTPSGVSVCQFSIAVNRKRSKDGEQTADFINCVAWRNTAEFLARFFRKGSSVCVVGAIQTRSWQDQNGQKRNAVEVLVDEALFVDGKNDAQTSESVSPSLDMPNPYNGTQSANFLAMDDDDDMPF